jgi:hypothetical protein
MMRYLMMTATLRQMKVTTTRRRRTPKNRTRAITYVALVVRPRAKPPESTIKTYFLLPGKWHEGNRAEPSFEME